jgi:hypothetical protein
MGDAAQLVLAIAALVSALGGATAGVVTAFRTRERTARAAAENAVQLATGRSPARHARTDRHPPDLVKELTDLLHELTELEEADDDVPDAAADGS